MRLIPLLFLAFFVWCIISWNWYVCRIKGLCDDDVVVQVEEKVVESPKAATLPSGNLIFIPSTVTPYTNQETTELFEQLKAKLNKDDKLMITGGYYKDEINKTAYDNIGLARAEEVKKLLSQYVDPNRLMTIGNLLAGATPTDQTYLKETIDFEVSPIKAEPVESFKVTELKDKIIINFPTASADPHMSNVLTQKLKRLAERITAGKIKTTIEGHTDNSGTHEANVKFGKMRADAIRNVLLEFGVDTVLLTSVSKGESTPLASNDTPDGRAKNRRVEILLNN